MELIARSRELRRHVHETHTVVDTQFAPRLTHEDNRNEALHYTTAFAGYLCIIRNTSSI